MIFPLLLDQSLHMMHLDRSTKGEGISLSLRKILNIMTTAKLILLSRNRLHDHLLQFLLRLGT